MVDKLSQSLARLDYNIEILTTGIGQDFQKFEKTSRLSVRRFYTGRASTGDASVSEHLRFFIFGLPQMLWYIARNKFDLLFCVFVIPSGFIGYIISRIIRVPFVVFVDAADAPGVRSAMKTMTDRLKPLFMYITKHSSATVICDGLQDIVQPLINNSNSVVIPNGTSIQTFFAKPGSSSDVIQFLTIGRLVGRKGFVEIIRALSMVKKQTTNFHLTIVGYGTYEKEIQKILEEYDLHNHVTLAGRVEYEKLIDYYLHADCYLFYGDREGSSLAMIEALSYGLPIIATDHPGNTTYVKNGINGLLVEHDSIRKLSEAIVEVINNKSRLPCWGEKSKEIAGRYSWDTIAAQYHKVFSSVIERCVEKNDEWLPYPRYLLRKNLVKKILKAESVKDKTCIEIGYGAGDMLLLYAQLGFQVYAYDFSEACYHSATQRINNHATLKNNIKLCKEEGEIIKNKYDYLMIFEVLEHIKDDRVALRNWVNLVSDRGKIIFSVPAHKKKWGYSDIAVGHYRRYEKEEIRTLCEKSGITIRHLWCYGFPLSLLLHSALHWSKKNEVKRLGIHSKEELSKKSGIKRKNNLFIRLFSNDFVLLPFYLLQNVFLNNDLGFGYIVIGEKTTIPKVENDI